MLLPRTPNLDKLTYEQRMQIFKHRAKVFMYKPEVWFSKLTLQPKGQS